MGLVAVCAKCGKEMFCQKNGVIVYHPMEPVEKNKGLIDFVAYGDKYKCPSCGAEVVIEFEWPPIMAGPFYGYTQDDLKKMIREAEEKIEIRRL